MSGLLISEITILVLIICLTYWLKSQYYAKFTEYQKLKEQSEQAIQEKEEAENKAIQASFEEQNARQSLQSIQQEIHLSQQQLQTNEQLMLDQERLVQEKINQQHEIFVKKMLEEETEIFMTTQREFVEQFVAENKKKMAAAQALTDQISQLKSSVASAVEIAKHKMEEESASDFYRLQLPQESLDDIEALRSIESLLHNQEAINKVIWKMYYEKPYTDLIGRVGLTGTVCGIYKITNIKNQMTYVGQAVNIADRWKQHIKRGVGADTPTQNKLYPAMKKFGPENFTFEIIEQCSRDKLNEREDYWQEFYKAKEFGYSIK